MGHSARSKFFRPLNDQGGPLFAVAAVVYLPVLLLLLATIAVAELKDVSIVVFLRDTTAVAGGRFYFGALSNIGILLWCATATACFLTSGVSRRTSKGSNTSLFFLCAGLITTMLMVDDLFLVHERVAPDYLGLSSNTTFLIYGALAAAFFLYFRGVIFRSDYALLLPALLFLAGSVVVDQLDDNGLLSLVVESTDIRFLLEDGPKLFGIAGWFSYFVWESFGTLTQHGDQ